MPTLSQRADYLARLMPEIKKGIDQRITAPVADTGYKLSLGQMHILDYLGTHEAATMSALARWGGVALSTMTEAVDRLVHLRLVGRSHDPWDRRVIHIHLTALGRKSLKRLVQQARGHLVALLKTLTGTEQRKMISAFETLERILNPKRPSRREANR